MSGNHTPGPWTWGDGHHATVAIETVSNCPLKHIADMRVAGSEFDPNVMDLPLDEVVANASLISAAPELLAALEWFANSLPGIIRECCPNGVPLCVSEAHDKARAAIAKAKGGG